MSQKKLFVLWSGGVDSTYLILHFLREGYKVSAGYLKILNNPTQSERELAAIESMLPLFREFPHFEYIGVVNEIMFNRAGNACLPQFPAFISCITHLEPYDQFAMGYVMNDDAISFIPEIRSCYESYRPLVYKLPELIFPLVKWNKEMIWANLPQVYKDKVTWCENRPLGLKPCGECPSCRRMKMAGALRDEDCGLETLLAKDDYRINEGEGI